MNQITEKILTTIVNKGLLNFGQAAAIADDVDEIVEDCVGRRVEPMETKTHAPARLFGDAVAKETPPQTTGEKKKRTVGDVGRLNAMLGQFRSYGRHAISRQALISRMVSRNIGNPVALTSAFISSGRLVPVAGQPGLYTIADVEKLVTETAEAIGSGDDRGKIARMLYVSESFVGRVLKGK